MSWIKMRSNLQTNPKVAMLAARLKVTVWSAVGALHAVWSLADQHTEDGTLHMNAACLDRLTGIKGIAAAMVSVGWLVDNGDSMLIPGFEAHQSHSAKARAVDQARKVRGRNADARPSSVRVLSESCPSSVREVSEKRPSELGTREEKRREEKTDTYTHTISASREAVNGMIERGQIEEPPITAPTATQRAMNHRNETPGLLRLKAAFPQHRWSGTAWMAWLRLDLEPHADAVCAGVSAWVQSDEWRKGIIPGVRKFLDDELWKVEPPKKAAPEAKKPQYTAEDIARICAEGEAEDARKGKRC